MAGSVSRVASSVDEAVAMVEDLASHNVDLIKLMITGGVMDAKVKGEPGILMMKPDMIKACCDAAHKHNLPVAAHVQSPDGVRLDKGRIKEMKQLKELWTLVNNWLGNGKKCIIGLHVVTGTADGKVPARDIGYYRRCSV